MVASPAAAEKLDLQTAFDRGFEAVKAYVDGELGLLAARIAELEARPPSLPYEGTWAEQRSFQRGCFVTHQGSLWHCEDTNLGVRPGAGSSSWKLAVKRGQGA